MLETDILDFMRYIRLKVANTTYARKLWQVRAWYSYLTEKGKNCTNVNREDVVNYLSGLRCSQQFRQSSCAVIREFYEFLRIRYPYTCPSENPAAHIEFKPDKSRRLPKAPSQAAVDAIFDRLYEQDGDLRIRDRLMAELAYGSGLRRAELARLNIEDIDLEENTAQVTGKGNRTRVVPLTSRTVAAVREYISRRHVSRGPLFVSWFGRRLGVTGVYEIMRHRVGIRPHLLRHACATHMLKSGCGIRVIQELLGHERLDTTYIYTAVEKKNLREVMQQSHPRAMVKKS